MPMPQMGTNASKYQTDAVSAFLAGKPYQSKWQSYFSRVRFTSNGGGAGAPYTITQGKYVTAFGYAQGGDATAGGLPGYQATPADTNLQTANQTVAGEAVAVHGIGIILLSSSDAVLAKTIDPNVSVTLKINGGTSYYMGTPSMVPGPGGLMGYSDSGTVFPDQLSAFGFVGAMSNGLPHATNYFPFPEPMVWAPAGQGDSNWSLILKLENAVSTPAYLAGAARAAVAGGATTSGTAAYTPPATSTVFVDYMVVLVGKTLNPLSSN